MLDTEHVKELPCKLCVFKSGNYKHPSARRLLKKVISMNLHCKNKNVA